MTNHLDYRRALHEAVQELVCSDEQLIKMLTNRQYYEVGACSMEGMTQHYDSQIAGYLNQQIPGLGFTLEETALHPSQEMENAVQQYCGTLKKETSSQVKPNREFAR